LVLELKHISFGFTSEKQILNDINLSLERGTIYTLMGANGSGKTTLFNIITGFLKPQSGAIYYGNTHLQSFLPFKRNLIGIGRTFQDLRLIQGLTVKENIELAFKNKLSDVWYKVLIPNKKVIHQDRKLQERATEILTRFNLEDVQNNLAGEISYGQQKLLTVACCIANDAQLLLLDEPVAGINPIFREQMTEILKQLKNEGKTIFLIEHNTEFINQVADSIIFLADGYIRLFPDVFTLKQDREVIKAYM
jgi:branched-chain amino acid transport system ATP-binding protein